MLITIQDCKQITRIPHRADFEAWKCGIIDAQYDAICDEINHRIEGHEVNTAGWIPGSQLGGYTISGDLRAGVRVRSGRLRAFLRTDCLGRPDAASADVVVRPLRERWRAHSEHDLFPG